MTFTASGTTTLARHDYVDWLRNLGILYLLPFHTSRLFDLGEPYYVEGEPGLPATILIQASFWFMPLLFLLAGMASRFALARRTVSAYLRERMLRLLVPLLFGVLVLVPPQAYLGAAFHEGTAPDPVQFLAGYFTDFSDLSGYFGTFTPGQLWFVAFLLVISVALLPAMIALQRRPLPDWATHPVALLAGFTAVAALNALPAPGGQNPFVYAGYFLLGFLLAAEQRVIEHITRTRRLFLVLGALGTVAIVVERHSIGWQSGLSPAGIAFTMLHYLVYGAVLLAMLGYGRRYLNRRSAAMAYLNQAAFPVYVVHQTVLVAVGWAVLAVTDFAPVQYLAILVGSTALSFAAYEGMRRSPVLRFLLGIKQHPRRATEIRR